jgi:hypothetical protein
MSIDGIPLNRYINHNPQTGKVEIAKPMPPGVQDELVKDFPNEAAAWEWAKAEFLAGRLDRTKFDQFVYDYEAASIRAAEVIRKLKAVAAYERRQELLKELKQCDADRHTAIVGMESELGHH